MNHDRRPACIRDAAPGKYIFMGAWPFGVHIHPDGRVFQMTPQGVDDGFLSDEGWNPDPGTQNAKLIPWKTPNV